MKKLLSLIILFGTRLLLAQCPTITCQSALSLTNCTSGQTIAATSNYSANITSRWIGPGNINIASVGAATSVVNINHVGEYIVEFKDNFSNCIVYDTVNVTTSLLNKPTFSLSVSSNTICLNSSAIIGMYNASPTSTPGGGAVSYTLITPLTSTILPTGTLSPNSTYTSSTCGINVAIVKENVNMCLSTFSFILSCNSFTPQSLNISGTNTVCSGSSVNFTANGSNHYWTTGSTNPTMTTIPMTNTTYVVYGNDLNNCPSSGSINVTVNTTCSDVWPGDANSDGIVNNLDVFEIGLSFSSSGALRSPGGNAYVSQFASNWTGTVSTGKNKCHADCNGDGLVDNADTIAIHNNYNLTHSFKNSESFSTDPDLRLQSFPNVVNEGMWNKADIILGDSINGFSSVYGIAFDLNFDQSFIETDSVYIKYSPSFINNPNQNIEFKKAAFTNGKMYAASVRTDGVDVFGYGKIAEFWFKLKSGIPVNSAFNASVSKVNKINKSGVNVQLTGGIAALQVVSNLAGIEESSLQNKVFFFPNPASDILTFQSSLTSLILFHVYDLIGREVLSGEFLNSKTIDLSGFAKGTYFIRFESDQLQVTKKLVID